MASMRKHPSWRDLRKAVSTVRNMRLRRLIFGGVGLRRFGEVGLP